MISIYTAFPDLAILKMNDQYIIFCVRNMRKKYLLYALMLVHPFSKLDDLKDETTVLYWWRFISLKVNGHFNDTSLSILQNIQDQIQCKHVKLMEINFQGIQKILLKMVQKNIIKNKRMIFSIQKMFQILWKIMPLSMIHKSVLMMVRIK